MRRLERARRRDVVGGDRVRRGSPGCARPRCRGSPRARGPCPGSRAGSARRSRSAARRRSRSARPRPCCQSASPLKTSAYFARNDFARHRALDDLGDLALRSARCPADRPACRPSSCRAARVVMSMFMSPAMRVGDDQRRRGEVVRAHVGVHPALEVAVARQHRGRDQVALLHRLRDLLGQRPGVADAGGAAVADQVEAERVEILLSGPRPRGSPRPPGCPARARS